MPMSCSYESSRFIFISLTRREIGYGFRLRLLQSQNRSSPLLKQIHIKWVVPWVVDSRYLSSASELNQFIVASRLSYEYDLLAIDNWGDFFKFVVQKRI